MAFDKNSSKLTATTDKVAKQSFSPGRKKTRLVLAALIALPLIALLAFTLLNSSSQNKKPSEKAVQLQPKQPSNQALAEEATLALRKGDVDGFINLLNTKIKDPNIVNSQGDSLLLVASTLGYTDAVRWLLSMGADVNMQNYNTRDTAVLRSVYMDHNEVTRMLVYAHADLNIANNYRQTPMSIAIEKQNGGLVDLFLMNGVKAGVNGDTLLRSVANKNFVGVMAMLKGGVDPNIQNAKGNTPLIISASLGDNLSVKNLLAYRANVNAANDEGNTALIYAARYNHPETVLLLFSPQLMQYRADVNAQNNLGETALYWAALKGYAPIVKILLAYDADKNIKTKAGMTAMDVARQYQRKEVMRLLNMNINQLKASFNREQQARAAATGARIR
ncbi:MAG: ankyrin repeat domain-containing protein [Elusimicrobiaceae bacterium]|nr:ankyrin repeat domain-containing protein [Elusimicrobiaceae bacterium]